MTEMRDFNQLIQAWGLDISQEESQQVSHFIEKTTYLHHGLPSVPLINNREFEQRELESFTEPEELASLIGSLVMDDKGKMPDFSYVLTEETTVNPFGVAKFPTQAMLDEVVPYLYQAVHPLNYWVTDAKIVTITFSYKGIVYWNKLSTQGE